MCSTRVGFCLSREVSSSTGLTLKLKFAERAPGSRAYTRLKKAPVQSDCSPACSSPSLWARACRHSVQSLADGQACVARLRRRQDTRLPCFSPGDLPPTARLDVPVEQPAGELKLCRKALDGDIHKQRIPRQKQKRSGHR